MPAVTARPAAQPARPRPSPAGRRGGYVVALALNGVLWWMVNRTPGWRAVPFLTDETPLVLGVVNASMVTAIVVNAVYVLTDPRWLTALGNLAQNVVGVAAAVQLWRVFPFAFDDGAVDWPLVARWVLAVAVVGGVIGLVVGVVSLVRALADPRR